MSLSSPCWRARVGGGQASPPPMTRPDRAAKQGGASPRRGRTALAQRCAMCECGGIWMRRAEPMTVAALLAFPGAPTLPIFAALERGLFDAAGITLNMSTTPSSAYQAEHLASGKFHVAGTAFDNIVAYVEGQGPVKMAEAPDFFAFMGATQIELAFITQPDIKDYADIKGKVLAMDALYTGFAFVLYDMLAKAGLS